MASHRPVTLSFRDIDKHDLANVGVKAVSFSEMIHEKIPVPDGFSITVEAHERFLEENFLTEEIYNLRQGIDNLNPEDILRTSEIIQKKIKSARIPEYVAGRILEEYRRLCGKFKKAVVLVRSSNVGAEQANFFNIKGETNLLEAIKSCWASHYTSHAISQLGEIKPPIVVQKMLQPTVSGVMYSVDPIYRDNESIVIEAVWGLNEVITLGIVVPDTYSVRKNNFKILSKEISEQKVQIISKGETVHETKVSRFAREKQKLNDEDIVTLAEYAEKLQHYYYFPQEIRWAKEGRNLYITQTRQVTNLDRTKKFESNDSDTKVSGTPALKGFPASEGRAEGLFRIVKTGRDVGKVREGDILVTKMTFPEYLEAIKKASAIVTDDGGLHSHAATVARELSIPCVVGTKSATTQLKNGYTGIVDGTKGTVFVGGKIVNKIQTAKPIETLNSVTTATKIYLEMESKDHINVNKKFEGIICKDIELLPELCKLFTDKDIIYHAKAGFSELDRFASIARENKNLSVMVSGIRTPEELRAVRRRLATRDLFEKSSLKFWLHADLPVHIIQLADFIKAGLDGIHLGSDKLTMLILDVSEVDLKSKSVNWAIKKAIKVCQELGVECSISGYLPSHSDEMVERLVRYGINIIGVKHNVLDRVRSVIVRAEKEFIS